MPQNNIVGYTMQGVPIYNTMPQATPRLVAPQPNVAQNVIQQPTQVEEELPMIWVEGLIEAKSYRVAPGKTVVLWDSAENSNRIYIKSTDVNGVPQKMKTLEYKEVDEDSVEEKPAVAAVSIDEVNELIEKKFEELYEKKRQQNKKSGYKTYRKQYHRNDGEEYVDGE